MKQVPVYALTVFLCGCGSNWLHDDRDTLDDFSHRYTEFRNLAYETWIGLGVVASDVDPFGFWKELEGALDLKATDSVRLQHATRARSLYDSSLTPAVTSLNEVTGRLDKAVLKLVEAANTVKNAEYRNDTVKVSKLAREIHVAYADVADLWSKRLNLQVQVLDRVRDDGGRFRSTGDFVSLSMQVRSRTSDIESASKAVAEATRKMSDTFSALKGKSAMKAYETREEKDSK